MKNPKKNSWAKSARILIAMASSIILVVIISILVFQSYEKNQVEHIFLTQDKQAEIMADIIADEFDLIISDLMILSESENLLAYLASGKSTSLEHLAQDFLNFASKKSLYDQVRYLDETGMEILRVNFNDGQPAIVPSDQLQNKRERYYFQNTFQIEENSAYLSPFDLNIELGEVEEPRKPMIRFGTPVFDAKGQKRGIIILNYFGDRLIHRIGRVDISNLSHVMLLNKNGYWLKGPVAENEWGFMYADQQDRTFGDAYSEAWEEISREESGQFQNEDGLFTFDTTYPLLQAQKSNVETSDTFASSDLQSDGSDYYWKIVFHMPPQIFGTLTKEKIIDLMIVDSLLIIIISVSIQLLFREIDKRRYAEDEFKKTEEIYESLVETSQDLVWRVNEQGQFTYLNNAWEETHGYTIKEMLGKPFSDFQPPEFARQDMEEFGRLLAGGKVRNFKTAHITKDNQLIDLTFNAIPLFDDEGNITGTQGTARDISEQKLFEDTLYFLAQRNWSQVGEDFFTALAKYLGDCLALDYVFIGQLDNAQQPVQTLANYQLGEILPNFEYGLKDTPCENIYGKDLCTYPAQVQDTFPLDEILVDINAESYCGIPLWDSQGNAVGLIALLHQKPLVNIPLIEKVLTIVADSAGKAIERRQADQEIQKLNEELEERVIERTNKLKASNEELEAFSYSISHDLRAPLRAINGYSGILKEAYGDVLDEEGKMYLDNLRSSTLKMDHLINGLLSLSRMGRQEVRFQPINITALAEQVYDDLSKDEGVERNLDAKFEKVPPVTADAHLLEILLTNLLSNAIKFTRTRNPAKIEFGQLEEKETCTYFVRDNGVGFSMDYADKLFNPFHRLHSESQFEGIGIGLAITQRIVQRHQGKVWVESEPDKGTTVYFTLAT